MSQSERTTLDTQRERVGDPEPEACQTVPTINATQTYHRVPCPMLIEDVMVTELTTQIREAIKPEERINLGKPRNRHQETEISINELARQALTKRSPSSLRTCLKKKWPSCELKEDVSYARNQDICPGTAPPGTPLRVMVIKNHPEYPVIAWTWL